MEAIRQVRARVSAGLSDVKAALEETGGDVEAAVRRLSPPASPPPERVIAPPAPQRPTTMDRQTHQLLLEALPALAEEIELVVPSTCFAVRFEDAWHRFGDGTTLRSLTVDLSGEEGGPELDEILDVTVAALSAAGLERLPDDPERRRAIFTKGQRAIRVWPARAMLLERMLAVMRVDLKDRGTARGPMEIAGNLLHLLDALQPIDVSAITRETFIAVGDDLPGGGRLAATFGAGPDLPERLASCGYRRDRKSGTYTGPTWLGGAALSAKISGEVASWEASW
jgi:hypothetical protein